ncbi:MAG: DNA starvation/stationary phase protection protein [Saprospiraceae bacterium]|nr:DNA starvation/stationary phase protection protein [Candidatus Opimibacter skivensis]MBL0005652.1 DNA starvation/stationary phase protection protein [Candidatus Opimibacter skivensis]MBP6681566.1 DNA starvation/stationary phase protection protein [Saprospiraceae bacterium]MBP8086449.1 DNA starvation/stationary phase protection protein [Saprospiraceae bacterium]
MKNAIGIETHQADQLVEKLNDLLANYMVFYQNTRGLHWNIKGSKFFELHLKFEELYNNLLLKVDEVAERILTLGGVPVHTFDDYTQASSIKALKNVSQSAEAVKSLLDAFQILILKQRELLDLAADANDEGTNALMSDYIREQEKMVWMYSAYITT